jgi:hypothetical protein
MFNFKMSLFLLLFIGLIINSGYIFAQENYFVSISGNDSNNGVSESTAFRSLNYALNMIKSNQTIKKILILDNINENIDIDNLGLNLVTIEGQSGKKINIQGTDVSGNKRIIRISGDTRILLVNVEISNGKGGGISIINGSSVTIGKDVIIANNTVEGFGDDEHRVGAGVFINNGSLTMQGNAIINNNYSDVVGGGIAVENGKLIMNGNSQITNNTAKNLGGGVYLLDSSLTMNENSFISNNKAMQSNGNGVVSSGGGIYCNQTCEITMRNNSSIFENISEGHGGGIFLGFLSKLIMYNSSTITKNKSNTRGGGVWLNSQKNQLVQNSGTISGNIVEGAPAYRVDIYRDSGR